MPVGELGDMVACYQIINGAKPKMEADDEDMILNLDWRWDLVDNIGPQNCPEGEAEFKKAIADINRTLK